jgi:hypothetical protein
MKTSSLFTLNLSDFGKGLLVAVGGAVVAAIESALTTTPVTFNWKQIGLTALAAGVAYLGKNFFTDAKVVTQAKP